MKTKRDSTPSWAARDEAPLLADQRTRRALHQFSLRTLLALLTAGCILLAWTLERAHQQKRAVSSEFPKICGRGFRG
jgi:hypothetical protein